MALEELSLQTLQRLARLESRIDKYTDSSGNISHMKWIPPFRAARALTATGAAATPSNTAGDWFHPSEAPSGSVSGTDYEINDMGGYWVDMYLCSSPNATDASMGTVANGSSVLNYISQPGVAPRVTKTIAHFKTYLAARFSGGGFGNALDGSWSGKGGLITDQHWHELWVWSRINRVLLHGNTNGYYVADHIPVWHGDTAEIGALDGAQPASYGVSLTGGGPKQWQTIVDDVCGNRWEFTDGLRLFNNAIYSAGKTINPPGHYSDPAYTATGLPITGVTSGDSVASYRTEAALAIHGIPASTTTAGTGPMDGQGFWYNTSGERITLRGGYCGNGALCPGALFVATSPALADWNIGARAVLVL